MAGGRRGQAPSSARGHVGHPFGHFSIIMLSLLNFKSPKSLRPEIEVIEVGGFSDWSDADNSDH